MSILDEELRRKTVTGTSAGILVQRTSSTQTISDLVDETGAARTRARILRDEATELQDDASQLHIKAFESELARLTAEQAKQDVPTLLRTLGNAGFSWRHVARLVGVSVGAIHKWKSGGGSAPEHRRGLARIVALSTLLSKRFMIRDVADWLEMPLLEAIPIAGLDLLAEDRVDLLLRWAGHGDSTADQILDQFDSRWREKYASQYEVFVAPDGVRALRFRQT